jgi:hypothetical protein
MTQQHSEPKVPMVKFWPGNLYFTAAVDRELVREDIITALERHGNGDWGDVCPEDREANETALATGGRLFSVYHDRRGVKFWIITEADRNATTVLLPDDY